MCPAIHVVKRRAVGQRRELDVVLFVKDDGFLAGFADHSSLLDDHYSVADLVTQFAIASANGGTDKVNTTFSALLHLCIPYRGSTASELHTGTPKRSLHP